MDDLKKSAREIRARVRQKGKLPSCQEIVSQAFRSHGLIAGEVTPSEVLKNFNSHLRAVWQESLIVLEGHEARTYPQGIPSELSRAFPQVVEEAETLASKEGFAKGVTKLLTDWYPLLRECFLSVNQSRKTRGGKDFELQVQHLFTLASVPYEAQETMQRTDFILPSREQFERDRTAAMVVSLKRTLKERWTEVVKELHSLNSPNVYLFTADQAFSQQTAKAVHKSNIHLVVWDELKRERFSSENVVIGYSEWARERLPHLRKRWKAPKRGS